MIFLTVGTQLPFDRLTRAVDAWCARTGQGGTVFGQIGHLAPESYRPKHFEWAEMIGPEAFDRNFDTAALVVSHAGMGSIITAMSFRKPIILLPRRADLGEQRNDHQIATVRRLQARLGLHVASQEHEVPDLIDQVSSGTGAHGALSSFADTRLIEKVRDFIEGGDTSSAHAEGVSAHRRISKA